VLHNDGTNWTPRHSVREAEGYRIDQPLDEEQGAGRVDGLGACDVYARRHDAITRYANWKLASLHEDKTYVLPLGKLKAGEHLDTTLTWLRHVGRKGAGPDGLDGQDQFYQSATLADFSLTLLWNGKRVLMSDGNVDNLEALSLDLTRDGTYALQVYRYAGSGMDNEDFGLAARVMAGIVTNSRRRYSTKASIGIYTAHGMSRSFDPGEIASVPEPSGLMAVVVLGMGLARRRSKRD
jgi:hypothetical protein